MHIRITLGPFKIANVCPHGHEKDLKGPLIKFSREFGLELRLGLMLQNFSKKGKGSLRARLQEAPAVFLLLLRQEFSGVSDKDTPQQAAGLDKDKKLTVTFSHVRLPQIKFSNMVSVLSALYSNRTKKVINQST